MGLVGAWGDPQTYEVQGHLNTEGAVAGLEFFKSLLQFAPEGGTNADYFFNLEAFSNGSTAMVLNYFPFYPGLVASMGDQVGFFKVPRHADKLVISLGGQGFSISTKTAPQKQEWAKQFIAWFSQTAIQKKWIAYPGSFTANTELLASAEFAAAAPYNAAFAASLDYLQDFWNVPVYNELLAAAVRHLGAALDGTSASAEALDALAAEHEMILMEAGLLKME